MTMNRLCPKMMTTPPSMTVQTVMMTGLQREQTLGMDLKGELQGELQGELWLMLFDVTLGELLAHIVMVLSRQGGCQLPTEGEFYSAADCQKPPQVSSRGRSQRGFYPRSRIAKAFLLAAPLLLDSWEDAGPSSVLNAFISRDPWEPTIVDQCDPRILAAKASTSKYKEDSPTFTQATRGPFQQEWWRAMEVKLETLKDLKAWELVRHTPEEIFLRREGMAEGYLGVNIERKNGHTTLTQPGLTKKVIEALGLCSKNSTAVSTPAEKTPLPRDVGGVPHDGPVNYASVVGMLLYITGHSRPDCVFAVHQCARYTFKPKRSHVVALKRLGRYLKGTVDKGLILNPSADLRIDCYPDADFAGPWGHEDSQDPHCARSRTGYVITLAGCPILWRSSLQTEIALSKMEA
ncbi:hypothetical protein ACHAWF_014726, partial [Thalassiosira exigua]